MTDDNLIERLEWFTDPQLGMFFKTIGVLYRKIGHERVDKFPRQFWKEVDFIADSFESPDFDLSQLHHVNEFFFTFIEEEIEEPCTYDFYLANYIVKIKIEDCKNPQYSILSVLKAGIGFPRYRRNHKK